MSLSHTVKKNNSSLQVLKTYQVLLENAYTMSELVQKLNENEKEPVFNNSVISKYINTCRYCGFNIQKIQNKYHIAESPFNLNLSTEDLEIIERHFFTNFPDIPSVFHHIPPRCSICFKKV